MANTKEELLKEAESYGLVVEETTPYNDLVKLVTQKRKEHQAIVAEIEEPTFLLLTSEREHDVTRVLDLKKGLSLFKFGRRKGDKMIPTKVPLPYAKNLLDSYPNKYKVVELPKEASKDVDEYFKTLILEQDAVDNKKEQERLETEIAEQKARLKKLQEQGIAKQIVRE